MTMTVEQAIEKLDNSMRYGTDEEKQAWQVIRPHIKVRVVTDEMVRAAIKSRYESSYKRIFASPHSKGISDEMSDMRAALQAALGGE